MTPGISPVGLGRTYCLTSCGWNKIAIFPVPCTEPMGRSASAGTSPLIGHRSVRPSGKHRHSWAGALSPTSTPSSTTATGPYRSVARSRPGCQPPLGTWTKPFVLGPTYRSLAAPAYGGSISPGTAVPAFTPAREQATSIIGPTTLLFAPAPSTRPRSLCGQGWAAAGRLAECGIAVVADVPGVGGNLQNHPVVYLATHLRPAARQPPSLRPTFITALRFSSGLEPASSGDLQMMVLNKSSWHGIGHAVAGLGVCLMHPQSGAR